MSDVITSTKNPMVMIWKSLSDRKSRYQTGLFLVEGRKMVEEAVHSSFRVQSILVEEGAEVLPDDTLYSNIRRYILGKSAFEAVCETKTPQGIAAVVELPKISADFSGFKKIVALDDVQDPGNVGTIIRTADAAGFDGVILSRATADVFSPKVLRSTMGSVFHIPLHITDDITALLVRMKSSGCAIISSQLDGEPFFAREVVNLPLCLVIGNEGNGIREDIRQIATHKFKLPMEGRAESLNAAVAAGIMMYDFVRDELSK